MKLKITPTEGKTKRKNSGDRTKSFDTIELINAHLEHPNAHNTRSM